MKTFNDSEGESAGESEHLDRNTNAGASWALWAGTARTSVPDDGKFPSEQMTSMDGEGDNGCGPLNARERDSLIIDQLDRVISEIHVREFNKMRQGEELFTYKRNYITSDTSDHRDLINNMIAGTLQAGIAHILVSAEGQTRQH